MKMIDYDQPFEILPNRVWRTYRGGATLDEIEGIGVKRKKALLLHFGSARNVARAGLADLEAVGGISKAVAEKIYGHYHIDQ